MAPNPTAQRPIGVAIAGLGFGEAVHLPALQSVPELEPVALWHPRQDRLDQACSNSGLNGHSSWDSLLEDSQVDAVIIATPPAPRYELAKRALKAGKHLLLEKPVALNAGEVADLQREAIGRGLSVAVDFEYRAVPLFQQTARLLAQGAVGTPWLVKLDWLMSSRANPQRAWNWYSQAHQGGGVLGALGTHAFDTLAWLIGSVGEPRAMTRTAIERRPDSEGSMRPVDADDIALINVELATHQGGAVAAQMALSSVARNGRGCWIEIYGSEGSLVLGSENQKDYVHGFSLTLQRDGEAPRNVQPDEDLRFGTTWSDGRVAPVARLQRWWAESIDSGHPMVPGLAEGLASQQACDRTLSSC
ncbi:Gfo/Idh/MocA family protein [Synechococcus sp. UW179A]|uniref:Gfo/Idh/MocA family protein n=1 Tax=Synechococcus sp. UW179A TaxID=2575510 RepID=UPI000E0E4801|nr:Gfo/Idh/MocA family oxidoreductase [Synechococcus sp. UW179A]